MSDWPITDKEAAVAERRALQRKRYAAARTRKGRRRKYMREYCKRRAEADPAFRLNRNMRNAIWQSLKGLKQRRAWQEIVGYRLADLQAHLAALFADGMGWHNIGEWHVDHARPLASFTITGPDCPEFKAAWALSNLQPLWAPDNLRKGATWTP